MKLRVLIIVVEISLKPILRGAFGQRGVWKSVLHGFLEHGERSPSCLVCLMAGLDHNVDGS